MHFCRWQKLRCCRHPAGDKRRSSASHLIFKFSVETKQKTIRKDGAERGKFGCSLHPYRMHPVPKGLSHGLSKCPPDTCLHRLCRCRPFESHPVSTKKKNHTIRCGFFLNYNAIFDTGCIGLQSCTKMQPKTGMQPETIVGYFCFFVFVLRIRKTVISV